MTRSSSWEYGAAHCSAFGLVDRRPLGDAVITGIGSIDNRPVAVYAQDSSVLGGSLGATHAQKIMRILLHAERARCPAIGLVDSGGARIQEGVAALDRYATIFRRNVQMSGRIQQITVVTGACAGGAVYSPALTDVIIIMQRGAYMFLTGPKVVKTVTHEDITGLRT